MHTALKQGLSFILALLLLAGCSGIIGHQYTYTNKQGEITELKRFYQYDNKHYAITAQLKKPAELSKDGFTLQQLDNDDFITITNLTENTLLRISSSNAKPQYQLIDKQNVQTPSFEQIKHTMLGVFNNTPLLAKQRSLWLIENQGVNAALTQLKKATNDNTKQTYCRYLSQHHPLDIAARNTIIKVIASINSDYQQALSLNQFIEAQAPLENSIWQNALSSTQAISSDYELARLLQNIAPLLPNNQHVHNAFYDATSGVNSDYEKSRLMVNIAKQKNQLKYADILTASGDIDSDYEALKLVESTALNVHSEQDFKTLLTFIQTIDSDYEMHNALLSLPIKTMSKHTIIEVIKLASDHISSDYYLARTLVYFLENTPLKNELTREFKTAISFINSDSERVKVYDVL